MGYQMRRRKGACDNIVMGNLTKLLSKLQPAVYQKTTTTAADKRNSANEQFVENVATINVKRSVNAVVERSCILEQMIEQGDIAIVGAMYNLETGLVKFHEDTLIQRCPGY